MMLRAASFRLQRRNKRTVDTSPKGKKKQTATPPITELFGASVVGPRRTSAPPAMAATLAPTTALKISMGIKKGKRVAKAACSTGTDVWMIDA